MKLDNQYILNNLTSTMTEFVDSVNSIEKTDLNQFNSSDTLLVMIDMINGFCNVGPLHSDFVNEMIPSTSIFLNKIIEKNIPVVSYRDSHPENAEEFKSFPPHCIANTNESELVNELKRKELIDVTKNSTNGFLSQNPLTLIKNGDKIKNILVIGCVTDICIRDFSTTMNKFLQETNQKADVYIIENFVDTFHIEGIHDRQVEHILALYQMQNSGIKLIRM